MSWRTLSISSILHNMTVSRVKNHSAPIERLLRLMIETRLSEERRFFLFPWFLMRIGDSDHAFYI